MEQDKGIHFELIECRLTLFLCFYWSFSDMDPPDALYPPAGGSSYQDPLQPLPLQQSQGQTGVEHERSPIQNSPWKESSLDQPYQKLPKPQSACSSRSR